MNNQHTLQEAVRIAVENGYKFPYRMDVLHKYRLMTGDAWVNNIIFNHDWAKAFYGEEFMATCGRKLASNQDVEDKRNAWLENPDDEEKFKNWEKFEKEFCVDQFHPEASCGKIRKYKYHLQNQVLEPNPLDYIRRCLEDE